MPQNRIRLKSDHKEEQLEDQKALARAAVTLGTERIKGSNP